MSRASATTAPTLAELEQYLAVAAYLAVRYGNVYVPTFERM